MTLLFFGRRSRSTVPHENAPCLFSIDQPRCCLICVWAGCLINGPNAHDRCGRCEASVLDATSDDPLPASVLEDGGVDMVLLQVKKLSKPPNYVLFGRENFS